MYARQTLEHLGQVKASLSYPVTRLYLANVVESIRSAGGISFPGDSLDERGAHFIERYQGHLRDAEAYLVSADMVPVVQWAAQGLDDTDTFSREMWPSDDGFLILDEPFVSTEARGNRVVTKAISWGRMVGTKPTAFGAPKSVPGTLVISYTDTQDARDDVNAMIRKEESGKSVLVRSALDAMGRLQVHHVQFISDAGFAVGPMKVVHAPHPSDPYDQLLKIPADNQTRFVLALLLMLNQTITSVGREPVARKHLAHMARRRLPSEITVVQLRRIAGMHRAEGESKIEWAHRWLVKGHWRNQPYREDGQTVYRKIWIAPYVKGPEGLSFVQSKKVYALTR